MANVPDGRDAAEPVPAPEEARNHKGRRATAPDTSGDYHHMVEESWGLEVPSSNLSAPTDERPRSYAASRVSHAIADRGSVGPMEFTIEFGGDPQDVTATFSGVADLAGFQRAAAKSSHRTLASVPG